MAQVKAVPEGFHTVTPYLVIDGASAAIDFYARAFGAVERVRMPGPEGKLMHAELQIGDSIVMLSDPMGGGAKSPKELGGTTASLMIYTPDVDALFKRATDAGATVTMPPENQFWGDRFGKITDPFGHEWSLATHLEDLTPEEMEKRMQSAFAS